MILRLILLTIVLYFSTEIVNSRINGPIDDTYTQVVPKANHQQHVKSLKGTNKANRIVKAASVDSSSSESEATSDAADQLEDSDFINTSSGSSEDKFASLPDDFRDFEDPDDQPNVATHKRPCIGDPDYCQSGHGCGCG
ncbi:hypothetical protein DdX_17004 [Ditylenchus destructor]|uniref:Secreted protein n=1 Tax=Ditylenchus destructor TaxID=166010 RepID=A0AAD4MPT1_9BILA|nr:hypothetical protein DdX_17004 [Ditylenchus destructor]